MATVKTPSEQRVVLHNIGWATYERLLADNENNSTPRFAYDRGELEIMSPSPEHLERGFEPDSCFYNRTRRRFVARTGWIRPWTRHPTWLSK